MALKRMPERLFKNLIAMNSVMTVNGRTHLIWKGCDFYGTLIENSTNKGYRRDFTFTANDKSWSITIRVVDVHLRRKGDARNWRDLPDRRTITETAFTGSEESFIVDATLAMVAI